MRGARGTSVRLARSGFLRLLPRDTSVLSFNYNSNHSAGCFLRGKCRIITASKSTRLYQLTDDFAKVGMGRVLFRRLSRVKICSNV